MSSPSPKLHRPLVEELPAVLSSVFVDRKPADKALEKCLKSHPQWGSRDRRFVAETVYEIVRHARLLWTLAGFDDAAFGRPEEMSLGRFRSLIALYLLRRGLEELPEWLAGSLPRRPVMDERSLPRAVRESVPDWLDELGAKSFGAHWDALLAALNRPAEVYLRANTLKADAETVRSRLSEEGIVAESFGSRPETLRLPERKNVFVTKAFKEGLFEVQDAVSQRVAPLLAPEPGQRVLDACAGAGGKSLHLAALMKNKGRLLSMDIHEWKLKELRERARRAGVDCLETRLIEGSKTIKRLDSGFDRVLLDVPCTGLGVLRRNPDTKWKLTPEELTRLVDLQAEILGSYARMTKAGGRLVYATCSVLPRENEEQIAAFLASPAGRGWRLLEEFRTRPDLGPGDGFYAALLSRDPALPNV